LFLKKKIWFLLDKIISQFLKRNKIKKKNQSKKHVGNGWLKKFRQNIYCSSCIL